MKRRHFLGALGTAAAATASAQTVPPVKTSVSLAGDFLLARKASKNKDPDFLDLVRLLQSVDCAWANAEMLYIDARRHIPLHKGMDPHVWAPPWGAEETAWMGIDFVALANNHTMDYSETGMLEQMENLRRAGIAHAGAGRDLAEAAAPRYVETSGGRVGQVSFASTYVPWSAAEPASPYVMGRPGLNPLGVRSAVVIDKKTFKRLREIRKEMIRLMGYTMFMEFFGQIPEDMVSMGDLVLKRGDKSGKQVDITEKPQEHDLKRITEACAEARRHADVVLATIHSHESRNSQEEAAAFMQPTAHACIDAGADAFVSTGPHRLRGIEMYKGRPVFYSLGNFFFQYESVRTFPANTYLQMGLPGDTRDPSVFLERIPYSKHKAYWQSVVPVMHFEDKTLTRLELHPITMGFGLEVHRRGLPKLARGEEALAIIEDLARLSKPYGTQIQFQDDIGTVVLDS
ncbi:MAG: CapA family protein [Acidobacteriota bacterium]|nr:CapA family protein [Acidobacteriota bacterium]